MSNERKEMYRGVDVNVMVLVGDTRGAVETSAVLTNSLTTHTATASRIDGSVSFATADVPTAGQFGAC
jgi:hypothetical protein